MDRLSAVHPLKKTHQLICNVSSNLLNDNKLFLFNSIFSKISQSNNGLLTYSTPEINQQQASLVLQSLEYLKKAQLSAIQSQTAVIRPTVILNRKPRVNFHSIEDLASADNNCSQSVESLTDSGFYASSCNQTGSNLFSCSFSHRQSVNQQAADESDSDDVDGADKENALGAGKKGQESTGKKVRTTFTEQQKRALDVYFQRNPYPDPRETEDLAQQLVLPENVIKVWFQNKRSRDKQRKFSHRSRNSHCDSVSTGSPAVIGQTSNYSSPLVANLQMLTSRFNSYAAVAAAAVAQNANHAQKLFF